MFNKTIQRKQISPSKPFRKINDYLKLYIVVLFWYQDNEFSLNMNCDAQQHTFYFCFLEVSKDKKPF